MKHLAWLAVGLLWAGAAAAEEQPPFQRLGEGLVTSRCLGKTDTPLCAAETFLSCLVRANHRHCAAVGAPPLTIDALPKRREYRLLEVRVLRGGEADIPAGIKADMPAGSAHVVFHERTCGEIDCFDKPWKETNVYLSRDTSGWRIRRWASTNPIDGFISNEFIYSACRPDPRSPLCIVEGIFTCLLRGHYKLCRQANLRFQDGLRFRTRIDQMGYDVTTLEFRGRHGGIVEVGGLLDECTNVHARRSCWYERAPFAYRFVRDGTSWRRVQTMLTVVEEGSLQPPSSRPGYPDFLQRWLVEPTP